MQVLGRFIVVAGRDVEGVAHGGREDTVDRSGLLGGHAAGRQRLTRTCQSSWTSRSSRSCWSSSAATARTRTVDAGPIARRDPSPSRRLMLDAPQLVLSDQL